MGWDERIRVDLGEDWPGFWIELWADPPMGAWLDLQEAAGEALHNPGDPKAISKAIAAFTPLIADHGLTDREGVKLRELSLRSMSSGLFVSVVRTVQRVMSGEVAPVPLSVKRASSRAPSSANRASRRATSSGASRSA